MSTTTAFRWAERARNTVASASPGAAAGMIRLGGGYGFPETLPDIVSEAMEAGRCPKQTLQYGPLFGLDDLRDAVVDYLRDDGIAAAEAIS